MLHLGRYSHSQSHSYSLLLVFLLAAVCSIGFAFILTALLDAVCPIGFIFVLTAVCPIGYIGFDEVGRVGYVNGPNSNLRKGMF